MLKSSTLAKSPLWLIFLFLFSSQIFATQIAPDDDRILYTGRVDFTDPKTPYLSWPGTSIQANFSGNKLVITMDDDRGKNYYNVIIDGQDQYPHVLELKEGGTEYDLSHALFGSSQKQHSLEIFKRTDGRDGGSYFLGLQLAEGKTLGEKPERPVRKIAFFGDSITSGMGNEAPDNGSDKNGAEKNHYLSYAAITARDLDAEFHTVSASGIGFMVSWPDYVMPQVYDQTNGVENNDSKWDFNQWQPDVVVVNIGQNDSWLVNDKKRLSSTPARSDIVQAYKEFIVSLRKVYPSARFVSVLGSMDATASDLWPNMINEALTEINKMDREANISLVLFDYTGYSAHPKVPQHINNAEKLTQHIKEIMSW